MDKRNEKPASEAVHDVLVGALMQHQIDRNLEPNYDVAADQAKAILSGLRKFGLRVRRESRALHVAE